MARPSRVLVLVLDSVRIIDNQSGEILKKSITLRLIKAQNKTITHKKTTIKNTFKYTLGHLKHLKTTSKHYSLI